MNPLHSSLLNISCQVDTFPTHIEPLLSAYNTIVIGHSEAGLPIHRIRIGTGKTKVLMWSQMHGNESTTTKSVFDLLRYLQSEEVYSKLYSFRLSLSSTLMGQRYTLDSMPIKLISIEMRLTYLKSKVGYCARSLMNFLLIMHSIYMISVPFLALRLSQQHFSLLAPAFDKERSFNDCRTKAAQLAASVFQGLQSSSIASQIGRFDDNSIQTV